ncbi:non-structural maintenance of chromosomes element 4 homolog A [Alligator sinensis]|uniref:Non-structural maintenance of chromosomes element 4 n=1 Tax=Alligator sinensis TaxID=38654 RepID=A0A1U7RKT2_ALLSI|nr:non-structural maintenance of chromosomes element 4 homolog A [Alligator sinensis]
MAEAAGSGEAGMGRAGGSGSGRGRPVLPSTSHNGGGGEEAEQQRVEDSDGDDRKRRLIRHQYRELINTVQQNHEDMLNSKSNKLTEALEEANILFSGVSRAREAALDAQFLVLASNLGKEKANELHSDMTAFDSPAFAEDLLTFMGLNRIEDNDSDDEGSAGGYLPNDAWHKLGAEAETYFRRAPSFHFMLGSFSADPPVPRQRIERQKRKPGIEERRAMPAQLKRMEESHQEATEKEVERILGLLQTHFNNDPEIPISFFDFVIDPDSFARTVENIFHVSFIIRDGFARIKLDQDKLPIIEPSNDNEGRENDQNAQVRNQAIISLSHQEWKDIVETFEITESMIDPSSHNQDSEMDPA